MAEHIDLDSMFAKVKLEDDAVGEIKPILKPCPECEQAARELGRYKKKVADDAKRIEELEAQVAAFRETGKLYEWFVAATLRMFGADCREKAVELPMEQVMDLDREARLRMMVAPEEKVYIMWGEEKQ